MMIKRILCFLLSAAAAALCACSSGESSQSKPALYQTVTQFNYAESFVLPKDTDMGIYEFTQLSCEGKIDALSSVFFSADDKLNASKEELTATIPTTKLETQDGSKILVLTDSGRFLYHDHEREPKFPAFVDGFDDIVFPEVYEQKAVKLNEYESVSLQELSAKAQSYITDCIIALGIEMKLRPAFALIYNVSIGIDDPEGSEKEDQYAEVFFTLDMQDGCATVKPARSDTYAEYSSERYKPDEISFCISASMYDTEKPFEVESLYDLIAPKGLADKRDHLDCDEAIVHTYNKYSLNAKNMTLTHAELEYHPYVESYDDTVWSGSFAHQPGAVYTAQPYWALYFNVIKDESTEHLKLCVNALSGEIKKVLQPRDFLDFDGRSLYREPIYKIERAYDLSVYYGLDEEDLSTAYEEEEENESSQ
ncbi:MAG: hypothetical protein IJM75_09460 [Ruminococcus sp.]|nr:hypothetical protein [Ruminococcus sp.]